MYRDRGNKNATYCQCTYANEDQKRSVNADGTLFSFDMHNMMSSDGTEWKDKK